MRLWDKTKQHETSLSDSEDEGTGGRRHRQSHRDSSTSGRKKRRSGSPLTGSNGTSGTPVPAAATNGTIDSGLLNDPPTADALRTTKGPDGDVEMGSEANGA